MFGKKETLFLIIFFQNWGGHSVSFFFVTDTFPDISDFFKVKLSFQKKPIKMLICGACRSHAHGDEKTLLF